MNENIIFAMLGFFVFVFTIFVFGPAFMARTEGELNTMIKTRPLLAKAITRKGARSYLRSCVFVVISIIGCMVLANDAEAPVNMDLAGMAFTAVFLLSIFRVWKLRRLLGIPATQ